MYDVPDEMADHSAQISAAMTPSNGTLIPPVTKPLRRGGKLISFDIDKWGFKDDVIKVCGHYAICVVAYVPSMLH